MKGYGSKLIPRRNILPVEGKNLSFVEEDEGGSPTMEKVDAKLLEVFSYSDGTSPVLNQIDSDLESTRFTESTQRGGKSSALFGSKGTSPQAKGKWAHLVTISDERKMDSVGSSPPAGTAANGGASVSGTDKGNGDLSE